MEDKKYIVVRYFDTYPDGVQARNLDYQSAKKIADELNCKNNRPYVEYLVRVSSEDDKRDLFDNYEDAICELCKRNGHHRSTPCGECEGVWCEVSQDYFAIENNIELID